MRTWRSVVVVLLVLGVAAHCLALGQTVSVLPGKLDAETGTSYEGLNATFSWNLVSGATWYQLYCGEVGNMALPAFATWIQHPTVTCKIGNRTALKVGHTYQWWVRAWSQAGGYGAWSATRTFVAQNVKQLYVPAHAFRCLTPFAGYSYEEGGCMLNPSVDGIDLIAPVPLASGVTIASLELLWKNNAYNIGTSTTTVRMFVDATAADLDIVSISSSERNEGIQSVRTVPGAFFVITDTYHPSVYVHFTHKERWLMGVKVRYFESL